MGQKWELLDGKALGVAKELPSNGWGEGENLNAGAEPRCWGRVMLPIFIVRSGPVEKVIAL
jgi:hypothetical protein